MADINALKKKYSSPDIDIAETKDDERHNGNKYSLPYGLCKGVGIDTTGMSPREAWEAYENKTGISKEEAEEKHWDKTDGKKEPKKTETPAKIDTAENKETKGQTGEGETDRMLLSDRLKSKIFPKERVKKCLDYGTTEERELTAKLFNGDGFTYTDVSKETCYSPLFNSITIKDEDDGGENSPYEKGSVFYHETWHAIDDNYSKGYGSLSSSFKTSSGKTLNETIKEEADDKEKWKEAKKEIRDFTISVRKKENFQIDGKSVDEIIQDYKTVAAEIKAEPDFWKQWDIRTKHSKEIQNYTVLISPTKETQRVYGDLSDVYSGLKKDANGLCNIGHKKSYWSKPKYIDKKFDWDKNRGKEAFAEIASAKATKSRSYEVLKKYIPKTVACFEEIYEKLKNGDIKYEGK